MSHPWKAQPYYLFHDPRTTGTVPAPMGACDVRGTLAGLRVHEALAGYTRGSFAPKSPWAVPGYVASEPTGVDGYGFGADVAGCKPADVAAKELWTAVKKLSTELKSVPDSVALPILTSVVSAGAREAKAGESRFKSWLQNTFKQIASKALGSVVASAIPDTVWRELANRASAEVWGGMAALEVCTAPTGPTTFEDLARVAEVGWEQWAKETGVAPAPTGQIIATAVTPQQLVKAAMSPQLTAALKQRQAAVAPTPSKAPLLIGAAALAALLLLK